MKNLIAHNDIQLLQLLSQVYDDVSFVSSGVTACEMCLHNELETLILNMQLPGTDGIELLSKAQEFLKLPKHLFVLTADYGDLLMEQLSRFFVTAVILLPAETDYIAMRILQCSDCLRMQNYAKQLQRKKIYDDTRGVLTELGFSRSLSGYDCIVEAVAVMLIDETNALTTGIYKTVGESLCIKPSNVERRIRHAIEQAWLHGNMEIQQSMFGYTIQCAKGKPTNAELIFRLAEICAQSR